VVLKDDNRRVRERAARALGNVGPTSEDENDVFSGWHVFILNNFVDIFI
jgi:hypothetical protein